MKTTLHPFDMSDDPNPEAIIGNLVEWLRSWREEHEIVLLISEWTADQMPDGWEDDLPWYVTVKRSPFFHPPQLVFAYRPHDLFKIDSPTIKRNDDRDLWTDTTRVGRVVTNPPNIGGIC